ncbi:MAG: ankyrin repeat domain-containing protein [Oleiphilus sp.]|nr:MAG: ankyrin repeat domain-containing protein [Oleiphilus sp.]
MLNLETLDLEALELARPGALILAAREADVAGLKAALLEGEKLNGYTDEGNAFSAALQAGHFAIAEFLLKAGATFDKGFGAGQDSALMIAAANGHNELLKELIVRGADLDYIADGGYTAVARAALNRHLTSLKILVNAGAAVNTIADGKSVLMYTVIDNNPILAQVLINAGADVNFRDANGDTALRLARRAGYYDLDLMLVQAGGRL